MIILGLLCAAASFFPLYRFDRRALQRKNRMRAIYRRVFILGAVLLCLSGCGIKNNLLGGKTIQKTYKELGEIFNRYGIQGTTAQMIEDLEQDYKSLPPEVELNKAAMLLTVLGQGDYDFESMTWTPYENGVYTFDVEVFNVEKMYTDFLTGVSSLDKEELDFKNIQEDTSQVNWEEGTGKRTVTFEWKNRQFTLEAEVVDDWFDVSVANELNKIIKEYGNEKQLFFTSDGYQEGIVFYRDKEWADGFQLETGLGLVEFN